MSCLRTVLIASIFGAAIIYGASHLHNAVQTPTDSPKEFTWESPHLTPAVGVDYRYFAEGTPQVAPSHSDALLIDVDLDKAAMKVTLAADSLNRNRSGKLFGAAHSVVDWCRLKQAIAGVNGGYFGDTDGESKQIEGLLIHDKRVYNTAGWIRSTRKPGQSYVRCAFSIDQAGKPNIGWATCGRNGSLETYSSPIGPSRGTPIKAVFAMACGPRLIAAGKARVTDKQERLVSPSALPRTFVAYDRDISAGRHPHHMVIGIAMQMTYSDVSTFLVNYFQAFHHSICSDAMCLDGGNSSQLAFMKPNTAQTDAAAYVDARPSNVSVPTAILIVPR